jgi:hypothetical protein
VSPKQSYETPSVRQLASLVNRVAPRDPSRWEGRERIPGAGGVPIQVSPERGRQLHMVVGMFDRAFSPTAEAVAGLPRADVRNLFSSRSLRAFWELAVAGQLRSRPQEVGRVLPVASQRIVRDCLGMLAAKLVPGRRVWLPVVDQPEPKSTVDAGQLTAVYRELVDMAGRGPLEFDGVSMPVDERARLLAVVAVVLDAAPRTGELTAMRLPDVGPGEGWVRVVRRPQNRSTLRQEDVAAELGVSRTAVAYALSRRAELRGKVSEATRQAVLREVERADTGPVVERYALRPGTRVALRRWLRVRERVVDPLEGGKSAVWVTLHASKAGPPGLPISGEGLGESFTRGMTALNMLMAGQFGWEPMPTTLDRLRRSVWAEPLDEPEQAEDGADGGPDSCGPPVSVELCTDG